MLSLALETVDALILKPLLQFNRLPIPIGYPMEASSDMVALFPANRFKLIAPRDELQQHFRSAEQQRRRLLEALMGSRSTKVKETYAAAT